MWKDERGANLLDTGRGLLRQLSNAPTANGSRSARSSRNSSRCSRNKLGFSSDQHDPALRDELDDACFGRSRATIGATLLEGSDACFAPVLSLAEAPAHPHNAARETFTQT